MNFDKLKDQLMLYNMNELARTFNLSVWLQQQARRGSEGLNRGSLEQLRQFARDQRDAWAEVLDD